LIDRYAKEAKDAESKVGMYKNWIGKYVAKDGDLRCG
jgi:hypothetical protein